MNDAVPPRPRLIEASGLVLSAFFNAAPMDLQLAAGEHWLISGPPASGKTTLARTLLGLISPQHGQLRLFGHDLDATPGRQLLALRRNAAFLQAVDGDGLFPAWSAFDNLALSLRQHDPERYVQHGALLDTLVHAARRYGIPEGWLDEPVAMRTRQQRTAIAVWRALQTHPALVVIDGLTLDQNLLGNALDVDRLLADALEKHPAIIVLAAENAPPLPPQLHPETFRRGRMQGGRLEWQAMEPELSPHA
ncbi:MAG: ATP-binding cassette domain-containing protein [Dechloromonas sp.]|nr:MAG: ATP-binding cassette domain-containing protein [Dechloromonas sp.]